MNDVFHDFSLTQLAGFEGIAPTLAHFPSRILASKKYESWVEGLYKDIDRVVSDTILPNVKFMHSDSEDRFNTHIAGHLKMLGYSASHDAWDNGHPDIVVDDIANGYKWRGESKIHSDYSYLLDGFRQLCERYTSGITNESQGAMIILCKNKDIGKMMTNWKETLQGCPDYQDRELDFNECRINSMAFVSKHKHNKSSISYKVRHIPVSLYFKPTDKSARLSNKN